MGSDITHYGTIFMSVISSINILSPVALFWAFVSFAYGSILSTGKETIKREH